MQRLSLNGEISHTSELTAFKGQVPREKATLDETKYQDCVFFQVKYMGCMSLPDSIPRTIDLERGELYCST